MKKLDSLVVIKLGGKTLTKEKKKNLLLQRIVELSRRTPVVLVHGGGPEITQYLEKMGIKSRFVQGLRYTDSKTMEFVEMLLSGKINKDLVNKINLLGERSQQPIKAVGLSGKDAGMVIAGKVKGLGLVGKPKKINTDLLKILLKEKIIPVISSVGVDPKGVTLNINADMLASALAVSLGAPMLIFLTDKPGILKTVNGKLVTIKVIHLKEIDKLVKEKIVSEGMIPK
ncbi:MAG TPA: acetylglutamate kinase, partial [Elusimicrobia bacterium]|nr:acetylglutamate kinase [Elusimicrobiota bacterium]